MQFRCAYRVENIGCSRSLPPPPYRAATPSALLDIFDRLTQNRGYTLITRTTWYTLLHASLNLRARYISLPPYPVPRTRPYQLMRVVRRRGCSDGWRASSIYNELATSCRNLLSTGTLLQRRGPRLHDTTCSRVLPSIVPNSDQLSTKFSGKFPFMATKE